MRHKLKAILERVLAQRAALAAVFAMGIKASGALLTICVFTLAARAMSADDFGHLAVWFNAMSFLAVAATFGQDTLIARSLGEYMGQGAHDVAGGAYRYGWRTTAISAFVFAAGVLVAVPLIGLDVPPAARIAAAAFLIAQTLLHYSSHSSRVLVGFVVSEANREVTWRIVLLLVVVWAILNKGLTPAEFFTAGALGMALSVLIQCVVVRRKFASEPPIVAVESERALWRERGRHMWLSAIVEAASQYADVMLIGYFASPAAAGDYFVAARIANIFLMITTGLNTYSFTHSAKLYFSGNIPRLQEILRAMVGAAATFATPLLVLIIFFGQTILSIFGARYVGAYPILLVLALAAFVMCLCGSASVILLTTGHERLYSRVVVVATSFRMMLTALLAVKFGALGAACGWALVNAPLQMGLAYVCWRACGVDPSILNFIPRRRVEKAEAALDGAA